MSVTVNTQDIISWDVHNSLAALPMATVVLDNTARKYSPSQVDLIGKTLSIKLNCDHVNYPIFLGKIATIDPTYGKDTSKTVTIKASSLAAGLSKNPVITHTYSSHTTKQVIEDLLEIYGGLSSLYYNITHNGLLVATFSNLVISESSIISAVRKVAQAANIECYVNNEGKLVTDEKKDASSVVDVVLQSEDIDSDVNERDQDLDRISACRMRGRYLKISDFETAVIIPEDTYVCTGLTPTWALYTKSDVRWDANDVFNAVVDVKLPTGLHGYVIGYNKQNINVGFFDPEAGFPVSSPVDIKFSVEGKRLTEVAAIGVDAFGSGLALSSFPTRESLYHLLRNAVLAWRQQEKQQDKRSSEYCMCRYQAVVGDPALMAKIGTRYGEIDNIYIQSEADAVVIGQRMIYESLIAGREITCSGPFNPELLNVNKVVTVPLIYSASPEETAKCLLQELSISYSAETSSAEASYKFLRLSPAGSYTTYT